MTLHPPPLPPLFPHSLFSHRYFFLLRPSLRSLPPFLVFQITHFYILFLFMSPFLCASFSLSLPLSLTALSTGPLSLFLMRFYLQERALRIRRPGVRNVLMKRRGKKGLKDQAGHGGERKNAAGGHSSVRERQRVLCRGQAA